MKNNNPGFSLPHIAFKRKQLAIAIPLVMAMQAHGFEFYAGGVEGSFDSDLSLGSSWRVEAQDEKLLQEGNSEDGNANFSEGSAFSQVFKGSHDLQLSYKNFGGFVRGKYWYDSALKDNNVDYGHVPTANINGGSNGVTVDQAGESRLDDSEFSDMAKFSGAEILDAYVYGEFNLLDMPLDVRLGKQVVSWGESTFIHGGLNAINPVDVNAFTRPGAEIKEGLIPVNMAFASLGLTDNLSAEVFYQLEYQETVVPGCGTYFGQNDFVPEGCNTITIPAFDAHLNRDEDGIHRPDSDGQYGLSMRFVSEALGDTEFGLYYMNIDSRTPFVSGNKSTFSEAILDGAGQASLTNAATNAAMAGITLTPEQMGLAYLKGYAGASLSNSTYFVDYPEDIQLMGLSFASTLGSMSLSGEVSHKKDFPIQINADQLIRTILGAGATLGDVRSTKLEEEMGTVAAGGEVEGYRLFDVTQAQLTAVTFFDRVLGADRYTLIGELGYTHIHDFAEGDNEIRYGRSDIYNDTGTDGFVTQSSWGYRTMLIGEYSDVFAGVNLKPSLAFNHDVEGYAPQPGGAFNEGQQSLDLSLSAEYLSKYKAGISYTQYMGGDFSTISDHDFASINVGMQF